MKVSHQKRFYSPQFSEMAVVAVRRLAWAMGLNMGQAVDVMVSCLPGFVKTEKVCTVCKDTAKCGSCIFKTGVHLSEQAAAFFAS